MPEFSTARTVIVCRPLMPFATPVLLRRLLNVLKSGWLSKSLVILNALMVVAEMRITDRIRIQLQALEVIFNLKKERGKKVIEFDLIFFTEVKCKLLID